MVLKAEYAFLEGAGTTAADSSGNGNTLSLPASITWVPGYSGGGIATSGTAGSVGGSVTPFTTTPASWTLLGWVKLTGATADYQSMFESLAPLGNSLYVEFNTGLALDVFVRTTENSSVELNHSTSFAAGVWRHIAVTFDATAGTVNLYVDGVLSQSKAAPPGSVALNGRPLYIGGGAAQPGRMAVDDVRIYDTALTGAEIATALATPAGPSGLPLSGAATATSDATGAITVTTLSLPPLELGGVATATSATGGTGAMALATPTGKPFVTSRSGRRFLDQNGQTILLKGDAPWSALANTTPAQWVTYCDYLASVGFNVAILDLVPTPVGGGAYTRAEAATYDGLKPFVTWTDWSVVNEDYWARVDNFVATAAARGISLLLVPAYAAQGATGNNAAVLAAQTTAKQTAFGTFLGNRYKGSPNILWTHGGDWGTEFGRTPSSATQWAAYAPAYLAVQAAIKAAGDTHLWTSHGAPRPTFDSADPSTLGGLSYDIPQTRGFYDFEFGYTYQPTYAFPLRARTVTPTLPVIYGEGNYSTENNTGGPATTNETLRRSLLWAYTYGCAGDIMGTELWRGQSGWVSSLPRAAFTEAKAIHQAFEEIDWWTLVPDTANTFLTSGQGTKPTSGSQDFNGVDVLESTYATASVSADGLLGVVYVPTGRAFTVNLAKLGLDPTCYRVDPANGAKTAVPVTGSFTSPGANSAGQTDWLYVFKASPVAGGSGVGIWDGSAVVQSSMALWDGTAEIPVALTLWDGTAEIPVG